MQVAFFCCFREGVAGMSRDLGRDVPDLEKLYARKLWAGFSYPIVNQEKTVPNGTGDILSDVTGNLTQWMRATLDGLGLG